MILAITKENEKLISEVCDSNDIEDYHVMTTITNLYNFTIAELKILNNFTQIIIDITAITDTHVQLLESIVALKTIYRDLRVTILAIAYKEGDTILSNLFHESVFDFVISKDYQVQKDELSKCINIGNKYSDAIRFRCTESYKENNRLITKIYKKFGGDKTK